MRGEKEKLSREGKDAARMEIKISAEVEARATSTLKCECFYND